MVSKLQLCTWDVTSVRQYSPALAEDGAIAPNVSANNAAAGAVLIFKSGFIFFSLCWLQPPPPTWDVDCARAINTEKKQKNSPCNSINDRNARVANVLKYDHHTNQDMTVA